MISSTHWLASAAGMAVLEEGGNAFDAAVAAGFALQVVEPHLNGPGGEVPIVCYPAATGRVVVVSGQGPAPAGATIERFATLGLDLVPGDGLLAATVPAAFATWMLLLAEFGTMPVARVLAPAIAFAGSGYPVVPGITTAVTAAADRFRRDWPTSAQVYLRPEAPAPGRLFTNPDLARTYGRVVAEAEAAAAADRDAQIEAARRAFYDGFVAEAIDRFVREPVPDSSGGRHAGVIDGGDLAAYRSALEEPVALDFGRFRVCKTPPWGQGPVFLQHLALLDGFDLASMEHNGDVYVHTVVECMKLAFADREAHYGDPAAVAVPLDDLLGDAYSRARRRLVTERASPELRPGSPGGVEPRLARAGGGAAGARGDPGLGTCHVDVVDRWGNLVSATPSGGWLQSSPVVPGLGFCLGTRAQMFWLEDGLPNSLAPGKRPRTTLSPSLALRDGDPYLAFGTPGGDQQDQWSLLFFLNHAVFGMNLQEAVDAAAFHTTHFPSSFFPRTAPGDLVVEERIGEETVVRLRDRGHRVVIEGPWDLGRVCAVGREPDGIVKAAASPRRMQGYAVGR